MLLQFGAEKEGREAAVRSLLSRLIVFLVDGRSVGRRWYSSCHGGGEGWEARGILPVTTGMGRGLSLSLSSDKSDTFERHQKLFLVVTVNDEQSD